MDRYFAAAWQQHWRNCWGHMYRLMVSKWGAQHVNETLTNLGITFPDRLSTIEG
jgi:hypothetical protein